VRGVWRELGVTVMLFIGLLFLQLVAGPLSKYWVTFLGIFTSDPNTQKVISNMIAVVVMLIVAFISYLAWFWLLTRFLAGRLLVFSFLTPLFGVWFGMTLMGDQPSLHFFIAAAMVVGGIVLVNLPARK